MDWYLGLWTTVERPARSAGNPFNVLAVVITTAIHLLQGVSEYMDSERNVNSPESRHISFVGWSSCC